MILTAIRYRPISTATSSPAPSTAATTAAWETWKFQLGTGRFRNYQCASGEPGTLHDLAQAVAFALTGESDPGLEVQAQLADDGGRSWLVYRRGDITRIHRDGTALDPSQGLEALARALLDLDDGTAATQTSASGNTEAAAVKAGVASWEINSARGGLTLAPFATRDSGALRRSAVHDATTAQLTEIAATCAVMLDAPALVDAAVVVRLARKLEPLYHQMREVALQYKELNALVGTAGRATDAATLGRLVVEVQLSDQIAAAAEPLLAPGVSIKSLREELAKVEAQIAETTTALGLDAEHAGTPRDFRKAIEVLARLETQARLVRASQGARSWCERHIEPLYRKYLQLGDEGMVRDRQIAAELESCLATLSLRTPSGTRRVRAPEETSMADTNGLPPGLHSLRSWFDRWKVRERADEAPAPETDPAEGLETERLAVEYALAKLTELSQNTRSARSKHESALATMDRAHEEATRDYGKLRGRWLEIATAMHLPAELDLNGLLQIAEAQGDLFILVERRTALADRINDLTHKLSSLERLVADWRRASGSQKAVDLTHTQLLLTEARDIVRYKEQRQKRLAQAQQKVEAVAAADAHRQVLKKRKTALLADWQAAVQAAGAPTLEANHPGLPEVFRSAAALRGLALVRAASTEKATGEHLFDSRTEQAAASIYVWSDRRTPNEMRLAFLKELEIAKGGELRLLLVTDAELAGLLTPLGVGPATRLPPQAAKPQESEAPKVVAPTVRIPAAKTTAAGAGAASAAPKPTVTLSQPSRPSQGSQAQVGQAPSPQALYTAGTPTLSDKAKRTLDLLKTNRTVLK